MTNDQKYPAAEGEGTFDVIRVVDGDTISVSMDGEAEADAEQGRRGLWADDACA